MDSYGKKELLCFYDRHLEHFGDVPQAVRWTPEGQRLRYQVLLECAGDIKGKEILDFGCGKGDFFEFLTEHGIQTRYCGVDVNEKLVSLARSKHPDAEFLVLDIEEEDLRRSFDVIVICGVFNLRIAGIRESMYAVVGKLFPLCREALHMNIPSARTPKKDIDLFYVEPDDLLAFALRELSPAATLRDDRPPGELFLSVFKDYGSSVEAGGT